MTKSITRIVSIAALTTVALLAQGPRQENGMGGGGGTTTANPPDVATIVAHQVSFLTTLLTLTTAQAAQATTIFTTALNSITPLQTQIATAQSALDAAVKTTVSTAGATITTQATTIGGLQGQILAIQGKADNAFFLLLTTDQQTKLGTFGGDFFGRGLGDIHIPGGGH
jgi:hypothetical protein